MQTRSKDIVMCLPRHKWMIRRCTTWCFVFTWAVNDKLKAPTGFDDISPSILINNHSIFFAIDINARLTSFPVTISFLNNDLHLFVFSWKRVWLFSIDSPSRLSSKSEARNFSRRSRDHPQEARWVDDPLGPHPQYPPQRQGHLRGTRSLVSRAADRRLGAP